MDLFYCISDLKFCYYKKIALLIVLFATSTVAMSVNKEVVPVLNNEQRVLIAPIELHLTNSEQALINSTVSLNHSDAWLFFDNIRPSVVISNYLALIYVNGEKFIEGFNGRISIYGQGTVLLPSSSGILPLTVYTDKNYVGDSLQLGVQTYYNNLSEFDNTIESFKLKRGYMATFATKADGKGFSRVFIADNEDLLLNSVQLELLNTISFIRVFEYNWVSKKGWCGWNANDMQITNSTWYYDWNADGTTSENIEYTPIKQNAGWPSWGTINNKQKVSHLLGYNEPDHTEQSNVSVDAAINMWPDFLSSGLRLGAPATTNFSWLYSFMDQCEALNYRVDFVAIHAYWGGKSPSNWYNDLKYIHERTGRPLWITEWNNGANWTSEWWPDADHSLSPANAQKQLDDLKRILEVLDTASFVERYSIYNWVQDCRAMVLADTLTPAGKYYAANPSKIAFNQQKEVQPSKWKYEKPVLTYRYLSLSDLIKLTWTDNNGDLTRGYVLEKKTKNGDFETIYESTDYSLTNFGDILDSALSGIISYRLGLLSVYGDYIYSDVVSYYQSGGDTIQTGDFPLNNTDWNTCLFSTELAEKPIVVSGIPSFNNIVAMTHRLNAISSTTFKIKYMPWSYLNNPTLKKYDDIAITALPKGTYQFGALHGEAGEVTNVAGEWVSVAFEKSFTQIPAVFCTQISNSTYFATTPAIRNVSTTGFELSLKCEETISSSSIKGEIINYLAVEPGQGAIGNNRISVGVTGDDEPGITSKSYKLAFNDSYTEPSLFASMLSTSDVFASTLRYYQTGEAEFTIIKHRELSGKVSAVKEEKLGWMVMDMAKGQTVSVDETTLRSLSYYPNPITDRIYIDSPEPVSVQLFDCTGVEVLQIGRVLNSFDISFLRPGAYILKIDHCAPVKVIKQ